MAGSRFTIADMSDVAHPDAWRDDRLVLDLAEYRASDSWSSAIEYTDYAPVGLP